MPEVVLVAHAASEELPVRIDFDLVDVLEALASGFTGISQTFGGDPASLHEVQIDPPERTFRHGSQGVTVRERGKQIRLLDQQLLPLRGFGKSLKGLLEARS